MCAAFEHACTWPCVVVDRGFRLQPSSRTSFPFPGALLSSHVTSRTLRRRDRSPSSLPRKSRRREHKDNLVLDGMDWNNLASWQHNSGYNTSSAFPTPSGNYQPNPPSSQQFHYPPVNYMMPAKFVTPVMTPPVTTSQATPSPAYPASLRVDLKKAWLTPSDDWKPGDGMFDINQLYNFSLPMTVAKTPHNNLRDLSA